MDLAFYACVSVYTYMYVSRRAAGNLKDGLVGEKGYGPTYSICEKHSHFPYIKAAMAFMDTDYLFPGLVGFLVFEEAASA